MIRSPAHAVPEVMRRGVPQADRLTCLHGQRSAPRGQPYADASLLEVLPRTQAFQFRRLTRQSRRPLANNRRRPAWTSSGLILALAKKGGALRTSSVRLG